MSDISTFPTLFKRTSTGKIQVWYMQIDEDRYRSVSGQQDGKKTTSEWTVAKPKNIGKANATTGREQAIAEVEAEYEKKKARDYHPTATTVDTAMRFKPMLATKWADRKDKLSDSVRLAMQPKLDGVRCIANAQAQGLWTREGKPIYGAPHIQRALATLFKAKPDLILDGELYNHDLKNDFNKIVSAVKKQNPTAKDLALSEQSIQYWVYDMPSFKGHFHARSKELHYILPHHPSLVFVETSMFIDKDGVDEIAAKFIDEGFEGAMVRLDQPYENKRSANLIKWKEFQDEEFIIADIQEGDGNRAGMAARVVLNLKDGRTFSAGLIGNVDYCTELLKEKSKHIGKKGTVIFQNLTPDGIPRFPKFKGVRFDV